MTSLSLHHFLIRFTYVTNTATTREQGMEVQTLVYQYPWVYNVYISVYIQEIKRRILLSKIPFYLKIISCYGETCKINI